MKTTEEAKPFSLFTASAAKPLEGIRAAHLLLKDAIGHRIPAWQTALKSLASLDPLQAQQAVSQAIDRKNLSEYLKILVSEDKSAREVVDRAIMKLASTETTGLGDAIRIALKKHFGLSDLQIEGIVKEGKTVRDYLCPFVMRPAESIKGIHLDELVNEPDDRPTAGHVSVWVYRKHGVISHLVVSGHANHAVCKEISAKIAATNIRLEDQPVQSFSITGAALLIRTASERINASKSGITEPPLEDLIKQLREVEAMTGMLRIHEVQGIEYEQACSLFEHSIKENFQSSNPMILRHEGQGEKDRAVFLPFYDLTAASLSSVTLEIDIDDFGPEFPALLEMHGEEYIYEMIADAKRRREIYAGWLYDDQYHLSALVREMFRRMAEVMDIPDRGDLVDRYVRILETGDADINLPWSPDQPLNNRHVLMNMRAQRLAQFIQSANLPWTMDQSDFPQLREMTPTRLVQPAMFTAALQTIQVPEYSVSGMRNFADATVKDGPVVYKIALQEQVEWNLPSLIATDQRWLKHMDEILEQIDVSDPKRRVRMDAGSLQLFVDSFLRGWPSVFLPSKSQKERYDAWCQNYRQKVWEIIREKLFIRGMRMEPLASDNVVFNVRRTSQSKVEITPYYLANQRTFLVMLHQNYGMTYYINPWQGRKIRAISFPSVQQKRKEYMQIFENAIKQLSQGQYSEALDGFKQSLRLYPIAAGEALLSRYWAENYRDTNQEFKFFSELASALVDFDKNPRQSCNVFSKFIITHPDFLPDPYLFLGFSEHKQSEKFFKMKHELAELQDESRKELDDLIKAGVLVPENDGLGGGMKYKVIGGSYLNNIRIESLNQRQATIEKARKDLELQERLVWDDIRQSPNEKIRHAMALDQVYMASIFKSNKLEVSTNFRRLVGPLHGVLRAQAFMKIRSNLEKALHEKGESLIERLKVRGAASQTKILKELAQIVSNQNGGPYLTADDLKPLTNLREFLEQLQTVDSITRENLIRHQFEEAIGACVRNAYRAYDTAVNYNMGLTEIRRQYTDCIGYTWNYMSAVKSLIGSDKIVLHNGLVHTHFTVVDAKSLSFDRIAIDDQAETINLVTPQGQVQPILKHNGLDQEAYRHLKSEFENQNFLAQVRASGLRMPYALLFVPLRAHPVMQRWQKILIELTPWLIQSIAHLGLLPLEDRSINREEVLKFSDEVDVVDQIVVELDNVCDIFLGKIDHMGLNIVIKNI